MRMYDIILKKREGQTLTAQELNFFIEKFTQGVIPDYQASALMMAIYFKGLDSNETLALTKAMIRSGEVIDLSSIPGIKVDKHSTGGVGDKTSIVLGPLVAACGVPVAKLSGRGLGHTGGTIDKLESFSGFNVNLSELEFIHNVKAIGIAITAQTANLAPADKKLYALRDVTATVENKSLIAGSIMSKKLASGSDAIVLDVKCGDGAFMKEPEDAFELARVMVDIGNGMRKKTVAIVSDMEQPLGRSVGNSLEVIEAIETLKGNGPKDLVELCMALGERMLTLGGIANEVQVARVKLQEAIASGAALEKLKQFVEAHGGDSGQVDDTTSLPNAKYSREIMAEQSGFVTSIKAEQVGIAAMQLGAGRGTKESEIDLSAGVYLHKKVGERLDIGEPIVTLFTSTKEKLDLAEEKVITAYSIGTEKVQQRVLVLGVVE